MPLDSLAKQIVDVDSHEMIPAGLWGDAFGESGALLSALWQSSPATSAATDLNSLVVDVSKDDLPIDPDSVWGHKGWLSGCSAPGAIDMQRRVEVLDFMGVQKQLVFPTGPVAGLVLLIASTEFLSTLFGSDVDPALFQSEMAQDLARNVVRAWNDWTIRQAKDGSSRLRPVAMLLPNKLDELMAEAERLIDGGVRAFMLPASVPPAGKSPADRALAPFWSLCEKANVPVLLHIAAENFLQTIVWRDVPEIMGSANGSASAEFLLDPWSFAVSHMAPESYISSMILGGVFERHPELRFGVLECGAHWIAPMAQNLDTWANMFSHRMKGVISMKPSEYVRRNIRVTAFSFEPVETYIEGSEMDDVYCYASDYPHVEGGKNQLEVFSEKVTPLGMDVTEKFFVRNGSFLIP